MSAGVGDVEIMAGVDDAQNGVQDEHVLARLARDLVDFQPHDKVREKERERGDKSKERKKRERATKAEEVFFSRLSVGTGWKAV